MFFPVGPQARGLLLFPSWSRAFAHAKSLQLCPTLCDPMDCSPPASSVHGDSPGEKTGVGCHVLLQGIFPTQGLNLHLLCLLHWQEGSSTSANWAQVTFPASVIWLTPPTLLFGSLIAVSLAYSCSLAWSSHSLEHP